MSIFEYGSFLVHGNIMQPINKFNLNFDSPDAFLTRDLQVSQFKCGYKYSI